jgi:cytochrome c
MGLLGITSLESFVDEVRGRSFPSAASGTGSRAVHPGRGSSLGGTLGRLVGLASQPSQRGAIWWLLLTLLIAFPIAARAQGTPDEAKALAERAAAHMREVGPQQAIADFNDPNGGYDEGSLFVVTYDQQRKVVSSIGVRAYLGRDARRFVDDDGKEFGKAIIAMAETHGTGWVDYRMTNPATMKIELKSSYVVEVGGYVVLVGAYRP